MSRLPGDRNSQQQPQQHNQIQQIIQPIQQQQQHPTLQINRNPASLQHQQQPVLAIPSSGSLIIINSNSGSLSTNDGILRTPSSVVNSIYYTTPAAVTAPSVNQNLSTNATSVQSQSIPTIHLDPTSPIAKKRLKLEAADSSSSCGSTNTTEDLFSLKKLITEHKLQRFKGLKDR